MSKIRYDQSLIRIKFNTIKFGYELSLIRLNFDANWIRIREI